jgi:acyl-CoA thioesterase-1
MKPPPQRSVGRLVQLLSAILVLSAVACGSGAGSREPVATADRGGASASAPAPKPDAGRPRVVVLGDSLTAGLGLPREQAYPALLQQRADAAGLDYEVINAGVSGDTSAGGLRRLDWSLEGDVRVLILALGANDGLRGVPVAEMRRNLGAIIERARAREIAVILAGMEAPPNFGRAYIVEFHQAFPDLAKQYGVTFVPFLLEGVAGISSLNQGDGIHPTAEGARMVADTVWSALRPILEKASVREGS